MSARKLDDSCRFCSRGAKRFSDLKGNDYEDFPRQSHSSPSGDVGTGQSPSKPYNAAGKRRGRTGNAEAYSLPATPASTASSAKDFTTTSASCCGGSASGAYSTVRIPTSRAPLTSE